MCAYLHMYVYNFGIDMFIISQDENAYIVVTISLAESWKKLQATNTSTSSITIQNETSMSLFFEQAGAMGDPNVEQVCISVCI